MKIDLQKLGLTEDSTLAEIQAKINEQTLFTEAENTEAKDNAAAGARAAAKAKYKAEYKTKLAEGLKDAKTISDEDMVILTNAKSTAKFAELRKDEILAKFSDQDFKLIVKAEGLDKLDGDDLTAAIKKAGTDYSTKITNGLPGVVDKDLNPKTKTLTSEKYTPGELGLFEDKK